jgi:hypothetical protein
MAWADYMRKLLRPFYVPVPPQDSVPMARLVFSFNNFQPIGVYAESLLYFDFGILARSMAQSTDATGGIGGRLKTKGVGDD